MNTLKTKVDTQTLRSPLRVDSNEWARVRAGDHPNPHSVLGAHPVERGPKDGHTGGGSGVVVRAFHPDATGIECLLDGGEAISLEPIEEGVHVRGVQGAVAHQYARRGVGGIHEAVHLRVGAKEEKL